MFEEDRAERAFEAALLQSGAPWANSASQMSVPDDAPSYNFPTKVISSWFLDAGHSISARQAMDAADLLEDLYCGLVLKSEVGLQISRMSFDQSGKQGAWASLDRCLENIASASATLHRALEQLRGEVLYRILNGEGMKLGLLYQELYTQLTPATLLSTSSRPSGLHGTTSASSDSPGSGSKTNMIDPWFEAALAQVSVISRDAIGTIPLTRIGSDRIYSGALMRGEFVRGLAQLWTSQTGQRATIAGRDDQMAKKQLSGFQMLHQHVCGHMAGLAIKLWQIDWPATNKRQRGRVLKRLSELGLRPIPTPTTLRRHLKAEQFTP
jgi:hypothetical protein